MKSFPPSTLLIFISWLMLVGCMDNKEVKSELSFVPTDTIVLESASVKSLISYCDSKTSTNRLFYMDNVRNSLTVMDNYEIIRTIDFNTLFNKSGGLRLDQQFYYIGNENDFYLLSTPIVPLRNIKKNVERLREYVLLKIDEKLQILDTIKITNNTSKNFYIQSPLFQFPLISNEDSVVFTMAVAVTSMPGEKQHNDYQINNDSRLKMFSQDCAILMVVKGNKEAYFISRDIKYPEILLDTNVSFYYYFPSIVAKRNSDILTLYRNLDTIYTYNVVQDEYHKFPFYQRHNTPFINFDKSKIFDYNYIREYSCEQSSNLYLKHNRKIDQTYIIVKHSMDYENEDGTVNRAIDNPFSVIIMDGGYTQIGEFDMSDEYSKHDSFSYGNGIGFLNVKLSEKDTSGYLHYVVFETKKVRK